MTVFYYLIEIDIFQISIEIFLSHRLFQKRTTGQNLQDSALKKLRLSVLIEMHINTKFSIYNIAFIFPSRNTVEAICNARKPACKTY